MGQKELLHELVVVDGGEVVVGTEAGVQPHAEQEHEKRGEVLLGVSEGRETYHDLLLVLLLVLRVECVHKRALLRLLRGAR